MLFSYNPETLDLSLSPRTEQERLFVLALIQATVRGGEVVTRPEGKREVITTIQGKCQFIEVENAEG